VDCDRCWLHGDPQDHPDGFQHCPRWQDDVATAIDKVRRVHKENLLKTMNLHANCFFPTYKGNPLHPKSRFNFSHLCDIHGRVWAIVEAAFEHPDLASYLVRQWEITKEDWRAQTSYPDRNQDLITRLLAPVPGQEGTLVLHQVAWSLLEQAGVATGAF
jgi:hypothetical protein